MSVKVMKMMASQSPHGWPSVLLLEMDFTQLACSFLIKRKKKKKKEEEEENRFFKKDEEIRRQRRKEEKEEN